MNYLITENINKVLNYQLINNNQKEKLEPFQLHDDVAGY